MKKIAIILGSLLVVLTFAVSGFSKEPKLRKISQAETTEKVLGPVMGIERTFELNFETCKQNTKRENDGPIICYMTQLPKSDEEQKISDSLGPNDTDREIPVNVPAGSMVIKLNSSSNDCYVTTLGEDPAHKQVSKEQFWDAAQKLIKKFPVVKVKLTKIVH